MIAPTSFEPATGNRGDGRLPALDGVRGIAILLVLLYHSFATGGALIREPPSQRAPLDQFVVNVFHSGWVGVDLFFVLSGFLITGILLRAKAGPNYFRSFYGRRFLRIFPLYYAFLLFVFFAYPLIRDLDRNIFFYISDVDAGDRWWFITYLQNYPMAIPQLHPDSAVPMTYLWSLAVEEQFYVVWPLVVLASPRRVLPFVCLALMLGALALRWYMAHEAGVWAAWPYSTYFFTPARIDTLAAGALVACIVEAASTRNLRLGAIGLGVASAGVLGMMALVEGTLDNFSDPVRVYGFSLLAILFACVVYLLVTTAPTFGGRLGSVFGGFAMYSYAIYILHPLWMSELANGVLKSGGLPAVYGTYLPSLILFTVGLVAGSFVLGWLSWHLFERHFLKLKHHFPYGPQAPQQQHATVDTVPRTT